MQYQRCEGSIEDRGTTLVWLMMLHGGVLHSNVERLPASEGAVSSKNRICPCKKRCICSTTGLTCYLNSQLRSEALSADLVN